MILQLMNRGDQREAAGRAPPQPGPPRAQGGPAAGGQTVDNSRSSLTINSEYSPGVSSQSRNASCT